eukprot:TRINITY_DN7653_c0_g3_i2.p2 TRINITY_DN7653_c0_g3~~TRINITY_DN7653_c0_g3_i2.p2  ORF type:complete len:134 (-),score=21.65 TRINITY_DN7653_c0_g3_i2:796-1197(-)
MQNRSKNSVVKFSDLERHQKEKYLEFLAKKDIAFERRKDDDFVATIRIQGKPLQDRSNQPTVLSGRNPNSSFSNKAGEKSPTSSNQAFVMAGDYRTFGATPKRGRSKSSRGGESEKKAKSSSKKKRKRSIVTW